MDEQQRQALLQRSKTTHSFRKPGFEQVGQPVMADRAQPQNASQYPGYVGSSKLPSDDFGALARMIMGGVSNAAAGAGNIVRGLIGPYQSNAQAPATEAMAQRAPQPVASPTPDPNSPDAILERKIRQGYQKYTKGKGAPMEAHIPLMIEAAKKYPIFQKYPYLIPAVSIAETQGGQNVHLGNNPLSWAARIQQAGGYNPKSEEESIRDMITAVGGDPKRGEGFDEETAKARMRTASYYQKFRDSGNLEDFTTTYEPPKNNPRYSKDVEWLMNQFANDGEF